MEKKASSLDSGVRRPVAVLEHLTGPSRGTVTWLGDTQLEVSVDGSRRLQVKEIDEKEPTVDAIAKLWRTDGSFEIETVVGNSVWINGRPSTTKRLNNHDMIEFGVSGPMSRFCICANRQPIQRSFTGPFSDSVAYLKTSRRPLPGRLVGAILLASRRLLFETTYFFRIAVIFALLGLGVIVYQQAQMNALLGERITSDTMRLDDLARVIAKNREEAITPADLEILSRELSGQMETAAERLTRLERLSTATARIIRENHKSVLMVQSAYGFRDLETGRMLRNVLARDGKPGVLPNGLLMLSLEGDGPIAERQFIGTAFMVGEEGIVVTNRHVSAPWEKDALAAAISNKGLEPILLKLIAYAPGHAGSIPAKLLLASDQDDLALLRLESFPAFLSGLEITKTKAKPGSEIILMGYPTGLRALLAQAGGEFVKDLREAGDTGFWTIAERLADAGKIIPLASRGIIGGVSEKNVVYDAETTHGGSGGPVFDVEGKVIAVNTAILPEYGGSNLGIPAERIWRLLRIAKPGG